MTYLPSLRTFLPRLQSFDFEREATTVIAANTDKIVDLQTAQLAQGIDSDGKRIEPAYRPYTIETKEKYGVGLERITDRVTFFSQGNLYRSLSAKVAGRNVRISSPLFTFGKMIERSGDVVVGLNSDSRYEFSREVVRPGVEVAYRNKVGRV